MNDKKILHPCCPKQIFLFIYFFIKELSKIVARQKDARGHKDNCDGFQPAVCMHTGHHEL